MFGSRAIKHLAASLGADLCGIAPVARFADTPGGGQPEALLPECLSVIVFARQFPASVLDAPSCALYAHVRRAVAHEVDRIALELALRLEDHGIAAVPLPSDPALPEGSFISLRHAAQLAGLGVLGRHGRLLNRQFGGLLHLGAVLTDAELPPDPLAAYVACRPGCRACLEACPNAGPADQTLDSARCGAQAATCVRCLAACPLKLGL